MENPIEMKEGTYYVGDLCYVMGDVWSEFCDKTITPDDILYGRHEINGKTVCFFGTAYGDGQYPDKSGKFYPVDAGLIGCILVDDINPQERDNMKFGHVHTFNDAFECFASKGNEILTFGHVEINTCCESEEEEYV